MKLNYLEKKKLHKYRLYYYIYLKFWKMQTKWQKANVWLLGDGVRVQEEHQQGRGNFVDTDENIH